MPLPRVAIVGRPNVGKSSLINMLARARVSIVDPTPGVTRDRVAAIVKLEHPDKQGPERLVEFVDTGGFGVYVAEGERFDDVGADLATLTGDIEGQIAAAIGDADLVLFAVDAQAGVTAHDQEIARLLRTGGLEARQSGTQSGKAGKDGKGKGGKATKRPPIRVVATKVDGPRWESHAHELSALGFGQPLMCSAKNNYFRRELFDALYEQVPHVASNRDETSAASGLKIAIVGKRNAGKSTLVNTLAGEPRMIVSEIAGTTRDAVDVRFEQDGKVFTAIDTAGLRKKKSFSGQVEWYAYDRLQLSIDRADVVMVLIDATEKISQVDEQVAMLAQKSFKPAIIVVNKWDLARGRKNQKGRPVTTEDFEEYLRKELKGLWYAPISFISGHTGLNIKKTIELAEDLHGQGSERVSTGKLNRIVAPIVERQGPPSKVGTRAKMYFVAQTGTNPPTIVLVVNKPELFSPNYQRFLLNRLREELPFAEVPMRLVVRARRQTDKVKGKPSLERTPMDDAAEFAGVPAGEPRRGRSRPEVLTAEEYFEEPAHDDVPEAIEVAPPTDEELAAAGEVIEISAEEAERFFEVQEKKPAKRPAAKKTSKR